MQKKINLIRAKCPLAESHLTTIAVLDRAIRTALVDCDVGAMFGLLVSAQDVHEGQVVYDKIYHPLKMLTDQDDYLSVSALFNADYNDQVLAC